MAGPGILTQGNLAPLRQYAEAEVVNFFSLNVTGQNGMFVSYVTGNQNPDFANGYSTLSVGAPYTNIVSNRYLNTRQVKPSQVGDTKWQCAGVTLHTTAEFDENGNKLILQPSDAVTERGYVLSGQSVPILKRGIISLVMNQVDGTPLPGYVGALTGNGRITVLNPTAFNVTGLGNIANSIVGRFISSTGTNNYVTAGGYAQFEVNV